MRKLVQVILKIIKEFLIITVLVGAILLFTPFFIINNKKVDKEDVVVNNVVDKNNKPVEISEYMQDKLYKDYKKLSKGNKDVVGVMYMEDVLLEPYVLTLDDEGEYIRKDVEGAYSVAGTPFLSTKVNSSLTGNAIIYGHNIDSGEAFGRLFQLTNTKKDFKLPPLYFYNDLTKEYIKYDVSHVFNVIDGKEFVVINNFENETERNIYNEIMQEKSFNVIDKDIKDKNIMHLQACSHPYSSGLERHVVAFKEVDRVDKTESK